MEQLSLSNNQSAIIEKEETQLLICPNCTKRIPLFVLNELKGEILLTIKCPCMTIYKQTTLKAYFNSDNHHRIKCIKHSNDTNEQCTIDCFNVVQEQKSVKTDYNTKIIQELKQNIQCNKHNQPYSYYQIITKVNKCNECQTESDDSNNQLMPLGVIDLNAIEKNCNQIEMIINNKQIITNSFIEKVDNALMHNQISQLAHDKIIKELEIALKSSKEMDYFLKLFYQSLHYTASFLSNYPCYQILYLYNSLKLNNKQFIDQDNYRIEDEVCNITNHLLKEHVIIQREQYSCISTLAEHSLPVWSLKLLKDKQLASASYDTTVKIWDLSSFKCTTTLIGHNNAIFCLMNCDTDQLISCSGDRTIKIWNTSLSKCTTTLTGYEALIYCMIKLSNNTLASGADDGTISIWNLKTFQCNTAIKAHIESVTCLAEMSDGRLASGSKDCSIKVWNLKTNCCIGIIEAHSQSVCCIGVLYDGSLVSGSSDTLIKIWHSTTYTLKIALSEHKSTVWSILPLINNRLASSSDDRTIKIWNTIEWNCIYTLNGHYGGVCTLILINDHQIASGSRDNSIKIWNI